MQVGSVGFAISFTFFQPVDFGELSIRHLPTVYQIGRRFCTTALISGLITSNLDQFICMRRADLFLGTVMGLVATISAIQGRRVMVAGQRAPAAAPSE